MENHIKCYNCGADYGLHHFQTNQCPVGGVEETRIGKQQQWADTAFAEMPKGNWTDEDMREAVGYGVNVAMENATPDDALGIKWSIQKMVTKCDEYLQQLKSNK